MIPDPRCDLEEMGRHYEKCAQSLKSRILALIPKNPGILQMTNALDLFGVPGFKCSDLEPTMAMADAALAHAKHDYVNNQRDIDSEWQA
jgi:hypothetical protein